MAKETVKAPAAIVFGVAGTNLGEAETALFRRVQPAGFILFARNCVDPGQLSRLIADLRACVDDSDPLILVDQEGGRAQRLGPPAWPAIPPARRFANLADQDESLAIEAAWLNARMTATELAAVGITVNCAPVLDVPIQGADAIIGDRAYGDSADRVALLGRAVAGGLLAGGVLPVIKHLPGHGRARVDSHVSLPRVGSDRATLRGSDFAPFAALADQPCGMTAHVVYEAIDASAPATVSKTVIDEIIRGDIGFDGLLFSDDICMGALSGAPSERAVGALNAGCDIVLHCNANLDEMTALGTVCSPLTEAAWRRLEQAKSTRTPVDDGFDVAAARSRLGEILAA